MYACHAHYIKIGSIEYEIFMSKANIKACNKIKVNFFLALG